MRPHVAEHSRALRSSAVRDWRPAPGSCAYKLLEHTVTYRGRTLTGRIALYLGVSKATVRDALLIGSVAIILIVAFLFTLR